MATLEELIGKTPGEKTTEEDNKVSGLASFFAGFGSGLIDIPRGLFSLGASVIDLGLDSGLAAKVEEAFDGIDPFDELAEATAAGRFTKLFANVAVPGTAGFKIGSRLARGAVEAAKKKRYLKVTPEVIEEAKKATSLGEKFLIGAGGAGGAGAADAIFTAETNLENFAPIFTEPLDLDYIGRESAAKQLIRRAQFGTEGAVFAGLIGGTIYGVKALANKTNRLEKNNSALDRFFRKFTAAGELPDPAFREGRIAKGKKSADSNFSVQKARELDVNLSKMTPLLKGVFNTNTPAKGEEIKSFLNRALVSMKPIVQDDGKVFFPNIPEGFKKQFTELLGKDAKRQNVNAIFDNMNDIRAKWGDLFSDLNLQKRLKKEDFEEFQRLFGKKFKDYISDDYEVFKDPSLIPFFNFKPTASAIKKFTEQVQKQDPSITEASAQQFADEIIQSAQKNINPLLVKEGRTLGPTFKLPKELTSKKVEGKFKGVFVEDSVLKDPKFNVNSVGLDWLKPEARKAVEGLLGKVDTPFSTILNGTTKLSFIVRSTDYQENLLRVNDELPQNQKFLFKEGEYTPQDLISAFGHRNVTKLDLSPGQEARFGFASPLDGYVTDKSIADALASATGSVQKAGTIELLYNNFILYPKATSQLAKTVLSPVTHLRNLVSAGAFASANGLIFENPKEIVKAFREAYGTLDAPLKGARKDLDRYRKLLELGVVNTQVQARELSRLLSDVKFGETLSTTGGIKAMINKLSKIKQASQDLYVAEDDFWKIGSFALERRRIKNSFKKFGINMGDEFTEEATQRTFKLTDDYLDERAADIIRNNIPNYDMVSSFIQGLRKLPIGNFVSFPAEIIRTSANILKSGVKETGEKIIRADGKIVRPFRTNGFKRLAGFGLTTTVVPYGITEAFKAGYDVSEEEMEALRRYVPEWSKNSTLIPIRGDDGKLKYVDFSHANAYDTIIRPVTTMFNAIQRGVQDDARLDEEILTGIFESTKELGTPFISESIWTEAATDIIVRGGRTRAGTRLYTDQTPVGEKASIILGHIVKSQAPGSVAQLQRIGLAISPVDQVREGKKTDKYGRTYELGDELAGLVGLRAVKVDPLRDIQFKIADFRMGINNSRREFTRPLLRGGSVTPEQIIDRYDVANRALYNVHKEFFKDYSAALKLGADPTRLRTRARDRLSNKQLRAIQDGVFIPFKPSAGIEKAFRDNALEIGEANPYLIAKESVLARFRAYNRLPLLMDDLPIFDNPFSNLGTGITDQTTSELIPGLTTPQAVTTGVLPNNMQNTLAKIQTVDDFIKP